MLCRLLLLLLLLWPLSRLRLLLLLLLLGHKIGPRPLPLALLYAVKKGITTEFLLIIAIIWTLIIAASIKSVLGHALLAIMGQPH